MSLYDEHEGLIKMMASAYKKKWSNLDYDDLYQEASIAMWQAESTYNSSMGSFKNHALKQMKCYIMKYLYKQNQLYTPKHVIDTAAIIKRSNLEDGSPAEIAEYIHKDVKEVQDALRHLKINHKNNFISIDDDLNIPSWNETVDVVIVNGEFEQFTSILDDREQLILDTYQKVKNTTDLAATLGVSQAQASRLLSKVKNRYLQYTQEAN